jgi:hypothetical protein
MNSRTKKTKLAVVVPSRGTAFSRTLEELMRELKGIDHKFYFSHGKPIPDCFNDPTEAALKDPDVTHVLYCEDDMIIPKGILRKMLKRDYPAVALDYPFKQDNEATALHDPNGMAFFSGTGFLLVMRIVLEKLPKPIWRIDTAWDSLIKRDGTIIWWPRDVSKIKTYGLHDVNFGLTLYSNKLPIMVMEQTAGQRKLRALGKEQSNQGTHEIYDLTKVLRNNTTKNAVEENRDKFLQAVDRLTGVEVRTSIPENVTYVDGQAVLKEGKYEII